MSEARTFPFQNNSTKSIPLPERLRPKTWVDIELPDSFDKALLSRLKEGKGTPPSLIFWGPPGSGKTTLARLIGETFECEFVQLSAVLSGVKDVRDVVAEAKERDIPTLLFVDEIHRFNKGQQDAFLPHIESGTISLIGATTENPSFVLTRALLSRVKVIVLPPLSREGLIHILNRGISEINISVTNDVKDYIIEQCDGDARRLLSMLEEISNAKFSQDESITLKQLQEIFGRSRGFQYDRSGEEHYNFASAFIKSMRGSDPDAALYYALRMIEGGEDPRFIFRRMIIFASEDIGNADPRAVMLAVATAEAFERVGFPEGKIPLAQCVTYLSTAPKSNRSYVALGRATEAVTKYPSSPPPLHIRNAPTNLMKELGYGEGYQYPHNYEGGEVVGVRYLPDDVKEGPFYEPTVRGYEKMISERRRK